VVVDTSWAEAVYGARCFMNESIQVFPIHRVGLGTDLHRLEPGQRLVLGHVPIDFDRGAAAHSDGDVVIHAIIDALAGAAGLPDIGEMFPDTDPAYAGADSGRLLAETVSRVAARGYAIVNVDATIHAQAPRLGPYKARMREELARLLNVSAEAVSIKAKTHEGIDGIGRGEAIGCTAVVGLRVSSAPGGASRVSGTSSS